MADSAGDKPQRSAADKERSRQLSRPVSGQGAAKGSGRPARAQGRAGERARAGQSVRSSKGGGGQRGGGGGGHRGGQRGRRPGPHARRSRTALYTWSAVALVIVIVVVLVVVSSTGTKKSTVFTSQPVSATVRSEITHVPASVFNKVGTGIPGAINMPKVVTGQPALKFTGKPGIFALLGEFCPYCAAERWSIIAALSRFGSFNGLKTMQSSSTDVFPSTQTFDFATATYTSPYIATRLLEYYGQDKPTGARTILRQPTKAEIALVRKYDHPATTTSSAGTIPFMDIGNRVFAAGVSYSPGPLQGLTRTTIASQLHNPGSAITKLIIGTANFISAGVCAIDGGKPGSVCSSAGVQAAAKALKLSV